MENDMSENIEKAVPRETGMVEEALSRRAVLRGALVVGCSLIVPIAFFSSSAIGVEPAAATTAKKTPKAAVKYQNKPKGTQKCSICTNYIAASKTCKLVEGPINPNGWCILWAKKA
jgi:hypothetical protein